MQIVEKYPMAEHLTGFERAEAVPCAFCDSTDTELISLFGQFLLGSQYYCNNCHTVFETVRWVEPGESSNKEEGENKGA
jgi:hypothetical protein